jgi:PAS domain S-box-containing protein
MSRGIMTAQHSPEGMLSLLRSTLDATHDGIVVTDSAGAILERNDQFGKLWGLPPAIFGLNNHQLVLEHNATCFDDPQAFLARVNEIYSSSGLSVDALRLKDGRVLERLSKPIPLPGQRAGRVWSYRDITVSNRLAELNSRLAAIVESADDAIVSKTLLGVITSWNSGAQRIFGYQADEVIGRSITLLIPKERMHEEDEILGRIRKGERIEHYETVRLRKDKKPVIVSLTVSPIRDASGTIVGASKIAHDITDQKRADEMQARLAAVVESSDDAIVSKTLEGIITSWNLGAQRIFGYTAEEVIGQPVTILFPPELVPEEKNILGRIRSGQPISHYETERVRKDGQRISISLTVSPVRDANGQIIGASKIARDITGQKRQQEALRASEQKLRAVLDVTPECVKIVAPDGRLEFMNGAGLCMIECDSEAAALGQCVFDLVVPEHRPQWIANHQSICSGNRLTWEFEIIGAKGQRRWMETHAVPLPYPDGQFAQLAVTRDITARKQHDEERESLLESERAARSAAEQTSRLKDEFLATVSHELRTPLTAILGWSQLLATNPDPADLQQGLEAIQRNARAQTQLIEDLLDMSRIIAGKVRLDVQPTDLASVLDAAVDAVRLSAESKGIRLRKILDPQAGPVSGDPTRLQQIFWNLLTNAIKFTPKGGRVDVLLERVNSHLEVTVHDSGIGIAHEFLPVIFERFRQVDSSSTRRYGGLGLGLSIAKHLVELHGGTVRAKSAGDGQGATFIVALPLAPIRPSEGRVHPGTQQGPVSVCEELSLDQVKILVVDDEPDSRALLMRLLNQCKAEVRAAASAEEGLQILSEFRPDVLISDIGMPGKDGYQFIREVRRLDASSGGKVPAIALTAFARSEDRTRAMLSGYNTHIAKPIEPQELVATVGSLAGKTGLS